jgi:hypothetical protein
MSEISKKIEKLKEQINQEVSSSTMDLIRELIDLEIETSKKN